MNLSVLLPVKNAAATLARALGSIRDQRLKEWELVVVDDASTDGTPQLLEEFTLQDKRIRILRGEGKGLAAALNLGLAACRGEFIARMDADDWSHPDRLGLQLDFLIRQPEVDVLASRVNFISSQPEGGYARHVEEINSLLTHEAMYRRRFADAPLAHPSVMFRTDAVRNAGGYTLADNIPEDFELWLRLFARGARFAKLPEVLLDWYDSPDRLSRSHPAYRKQAFWQLKARYFATWYSQAYPQANRPIYVWGETSKRQRSNYLRREGLQISGYVSLQPPRKPDQIYWQDVDRLKEGLVLVYVSDWKGRFDISHYLQQAGLQEGEDYFLML